MNVRNILFKKAVAVLGICCLIVTSSEPVVAQSLDTKEIKGFSQNEISLATARTSASTPTNINFGIDLDNWRSEIQKISPNSSSVSAADGTTGRVSIIGNQAFPIAVDDDGYPIIAASKYGNGRIVVAGAPDYVSLNDLSPSNASAKNIALKQNIYKWLTETSIQNTEQGYTNSYSEALSQDKKMRVLSKSVLCPAAGSKIENGVVPEFTEENLNPKIYPVVYLTADITDAEASLIDSYVKNGGSVVAGIRGWELEEYPSDEMRKLKNGDPVQINDYTINKLISNMGVGLTGGYEYGKPDSNGVFNLVYTWNAHNYQFDNLSYDVEMLKDIETGAKSKWDIRLPDKFSSYTGDQRLTEMYSRLEKYYNFLDSNDYFVQALLNTAKSVWNTITFPVSIVNKPYTQFMLKMSQSVDIGMYNEKAPGIESFMGEVPSNASTVTNVPFNIKYTYQDNSYLRSRTSEMKLDWQSTGLYALPGQKLTIDVPDGVTNLKVRIG